MLFYHTNFGMYMPTGNGFECTSSSGLMCEYPWKEGALKHFIDYDFRFSKWSPDFPDTASWVKLFNQDFQAHITKTSGHCAVSLEHGGLTAVVLEDRAAHFDVTRVLGTTLAFFDKLDGSLTMLYRLEGNRVASNSTFIAPLTDEVSFSLLRYQENPGVGRPELPTVTILGRGQCCMLPGAWDGTVFDNDEPIRTISYEKLLQGLNCVACPELVLNATVEHGAETAELDGIELWLCIELQ